DQQDDPQAAARGRRAAQQGGHRRDRLRRRTLGAGWGHPSRDQPRAHQAQSGAPAATEEGGLPHARCARGGAEEVRTPRSAQAVPVLEALAIRSAWFVAALLSGAGPRRFGPTSAPTSSPRETCPASSRFVATILVGLLGAIALTVAFVVPLMLLRSIVRYHVETEQ